MTSRPRIVGWWAARAAHRQCERGVEKIELGVRGRDRLMVGGHRRQRSSRISGGGDRHFHVWSVRLGPRSSAAAAIRAATAVPQSSNCLLCSPIGIVRSSFGEDPSIAFVSDLAVAIVLE